MKHSFYLVLLSICCLYSCQRDKPFVSNNHPSLFTLLDSTKTGIGFGNYLQYNPTDTSNFMYIFNGGGVAIGDINNDGLPDIFLTGNQVNSRLYLNLGNFKFKDITAAAGINTTEGWTTGCTMADVNGDGWMDIYVCQSGSRATVHSNKLYINQHNGIFTEEAAKYGLDLKGCNTHACFFDFDRDGDLDVYIVRYPNDFNLVTNFAYLLSKDIDTLNEDKLLENIGGKFVDVTHQRMKINDKGFGLSVSVGDINADGWEDIYVANDFLSQDYLFINDQKGGFVEMSDRYISSMPISSMGSDMAYLNADNQPEILIMEMLPYTHFRKKAMFDVPSQEYFSNEISYLHSHQYDRNIFLVFNPDSTYSDHCFSAGVASTDWSWSILFGDLDNDRCEDIFITSGTEKDLIDMDHKMDVDGNLQHQKSYASVLKEVSQTRLTNHVFRNEGKLVFSDSSLAWGIQRPTNSQGAAFADLDKDGYLDLVINNLNAPVSIYKNEGKTLRNNHFLNVQLKGTMGNTVGLGTRVIAFCGKTKSIQYLHNSKGFQSSSEPILHFGLGSDSIVDSLQIIWLGGRMQTFKSVKANQTITAYQKDAKDQFDFTSKAIIKPLLKNVSQNIQPPFEQAESPFIDFKRDKIIPHQVSKLGPKITVGDVNGDGLDDFYIGGAKGMQGGRLYLQTTQGTFETAKEQPWRADSLQEDAGVLLFDADGDGDLDLYLTSGSNEQEENSALLQDRIYLNDGKGHFKKGSNLLPPMLVAKSCVIAYDFDGDGKQDLFVGGRIVPERYGEMPRSYLLHNEGGSFKDVTKTAAPELEYLGMVTDAVWSDYNGDGKKDLIVVGEWMAPTVFQNEGNHFNRIKETGLENKSGWWTCITAADLDGDGDDDYVLGNWGTNLELKANEQEPLTLYVSDFDGNGSTDAILFHYLNHENGPAIGRDLFCKQMPKYWKQFTNYTSYAQAKLPDFFSKEQLQKAKVYSATTLTSGYIENKGKGKFELKLLPIEVQTAPINAIAIADVNHDGKPDLIMGGNTNSNFYDQGDIDASRGWILLGDGKGNFTPLETEQSGFNCGRNVVQSIRLVSNKKRGAKQILVGVNGGKMKVFE